MLTPLYQCFTKVLKELQNPKTDEHVVLITLWSTVWTWDIGWTRGVERQPQTVLTHNEGLWRRITTASTMLKTRQFANLDCWLLTIYRTRKACLSAECEATALLNDLIVPELNHAEWCSRMHPVWPRDGCTLSNSSMRMNTYKTRLQN